MSATYTSEVSKPHGDQKWRQDGTVRQNELETVRAVS